MEKGTCYAVRRLETVLRDGHSRNSLGEGIASILKDVEAALGNDEELSEGIADAENTNSELQAVLRTRSDEHHRQQSSSVRRRGITASSNASQQPSASRSSSLASQGREFVNRSEQRSENNNANTDEGGLFNSPPPFKIDFGKLGFASERKKRMVAIGAWIIVMIGLLVSIILITIDFVSGFNEAPTTIRFERAKSIGMPELYICNPSMILPWFINTKERALYPGTPLLWIERIKNGSEGSVLNYPETHTLDYLRTVRVNVRGDYCNESTTAMNPVNFETRAIVKDSTDLCFTCITLLRNNPIQVAAPSQGSSGQNRSNTDFFALQIGQHRFIDACQSGRLGIPVNTRKNFKSLIRKHATELQDTGILDYGGLRPEKDEDAEILFPEEKRGTDYFLTDLTDMYCNTFFFSGYFYPSTTTDIRFVFNTKTLIWERKGNGTFWPRDYKSYYTLGMNRAVELSPAGSPIRVGDGYVEVTNLRIYTTMAKNNKFAELAAAPITHESSVFLSQININGNAVYLASKVKEEATWPISPPGATQFYSVRFGIDNFLVKTIAKRSTVSWTAYLADFFGMYVLICFDW